MLIIFTPPSEPTFKHKRTWWLHICLLGTLLDSYKSLVLHILQRLESKSFLACRAIQSKIAYHTIIQREKKYSLISVINKKNSAWHGSAFERKVCVDITNCPPPPNNLCIWEQCPPAVQSACFYVRVQRTWGIYTNTDLDKEFLPAYLEFSWLTSCIHGNLYVHYEKEDYSKKSIVL
jgi:hypothetical protein